MGTLSPCDNNLRQPWLPPGFRFHPTDEELVSFYLSRKIEDAHFTVPAVAEADFNKEEPWELSGRATMGEKQWYFYSVRDRKYPTGVRANRATQAGYWKATGKDRQVINSTNGRLVGLKKTLVFYMGRAPKGHKTNWVMHEYSKMDDHVKVINEWVLCRVFFKSVGGNKILPPKMHENFVNYGDIDGMNLNTILETQFPTTLSSSSQTTITPTSFTPYLPINAIHSCPSSSPHRFSHEEILKDFLDQCTHQSKPQQFVMPSLSITQENFVGTNTTPITQDILTNRLPQQEHFLDHKVVHQQGKIQDIALCSPSKDKANDSRASPTSRNNQDLQLSPYHADVESAPWPNSYIFV